MYADFRFSQRDLPDSVNLAKFQRSKGSMYFSRILATFKVASVVILMAPLLQGCGRTYENNIHVATCENGSLFVREHVDTRTGVRGGVFANYSLYFVPEGSSETPKISTTSNPIYALATANERLHVFRTPKGTDWRLFVSPASVSPAGYESLASCIQANIENIQHSMLAKRPPLDEFPSADRVLPPFATIRYEDIEDLRSSYKCDRGGTVSINESGLVGFKHGSASLIGALYDDGKSMSLDAIAIRWPSLDMHLADPVSYFRQCKDSHGRSMFQVFKVSIDPKSGYQTRFTQVFERESLQAANPAQHAP